MEDRFEQFISLMTGIRRSIRRMCVDLMDKHELRGAHAICIYHLYKNPGLNLGALSELWGENKANVSRLVDALEAGGFVESHSGKVRRHGSVIMLSDKGLAVGEDIIRTIEQVLSVSSAGITSDDLSTMYASLSKVNENLFGVLEK